ncbi:Glyoxylate/succinic semialdehyde reductase 2 [Quillaja saponaria]|uniref:Glyoxylate/succinic semialdehyde reductase 2 n=1 Tax=Quillaja saponaria TaxID=32244 RepID=A0AAD7PDJ2_QUISA|nr:Glyoxylate/succinic semialdehyde reductase 2 [Quillaja saponaria]
MNLLVKCNFYHQLPTPMAMCSSFCPRIPNHVGGRPIYQLPITPLNYVPFKAFSSQTPSSSAEANEAPSTVGFLGLGIMGAPMAQNLIRAGCDVTVWNRTKNKCNPLISLGAKYKSSPEEVAASCDVTFSMLADPQSAVLGCCLWKAWSCKRNESRERINMPSHGKPCIILPKSDDKVLEAPMCICRYVDVSTVDAATSKIIGGHIKSTGALFLEAPVSGSKKPAEDGQLIFLTAGDRSLYEAVAPLLDIMGKSRFYLGDVGNGAAMKLVVNMIMGSMMASFSEGLLLSEKVGLDPNILVEVVSQGAISAPMYSTKGPSMIQSLYPTAFPLKHQQKDLRLALGLAESVSQPIPIAAAANELYKVAKSHGLSDQDFSAVIEALKSKLQDPEN